MIEIIPGQRYLFSSPNLKMVVEASHLKGNDLTFQCKVLSIPFLGLCDYTVGKTYNLLGPNHEGNWALLSNQNSPQC